MEHLLTQLSGLNLLKDIIVPMLAAGAGFWLTARKFKNERLWLEKYAAYQEILGAIEAMKLWAEDLCNESEMQPTIGWFDGKSSGESYSQARRRIAKYASIGRLLLSSKTVSTLEEFQAEIFREEYRANDERDYSGDSLEEQEELRIHALEIRNVIAKYLPQITSFARSDLGA